MLFLYLGGFKAYIIYASKTILGPAKMVLKTGMGLGALKDMVCSPDVTTIEAVVIYTRTVMLKSELKNKESKEVTGDMIKG